jgi:hypothetical protein
MITYYVEGTKLDPEYDVFIENVLNSLFEQPPEPSLDILIRVSKVMNTKAPLMLLLILNWNAEKNVRINHMNLHPTLHTSLCTHDSLLDIRLTQ